MSRAPCLKVVNVENLIWFSTQQLLMRKTVSILSNHWVLTQPLPQCLEIQRFALHEYWYVHSRENAVQITDTQFPSMAVNAVLFCIVLPKAAITPWSIIAGVGLSDRCGCGCLLAPLAHSYAVYVKDPDDVYPDLHATPNIAEIPYYWEWEILEFGDEDHGDSGDADLGGEIIASSLET
ncbi:hypothetical protein Tco_0891685 [Tanacetum coccineum]|uniref:Uncharacterized protein n=1 Tax=Tanacetum coccineum TaxID=301880 RepID=A0ABQ5C6X4_9ASTR